MGILKEVSREDLLSVPVPAKVGTYVPISNARLIHTAESIVKDSGYTIEREQYQMTRGGQIMIGKWFLKTDHPEIGKMLALGNSYNKTRRVTVASGANVFACLNGMFKGESVTMRKHMGYIDEDLNGIIQAAVGAIEPNYQTLINDAESMKRFQLSRITAAQLLGDMYLNHQIMTATQLSVIKREFNFSEDFKAIRPGEFTMWNLYNSVTQALKTTHPVDYVSAHRNLHSYVSNFMGVLDAVDDYEEMMEALEVDEA